MSLENLRLFTLANLVVRPALPSKTCSGPRKSEQRSDGGEESKKKRCNQLSANRIMDIFRCSPLNQNITGVVKKVLVNARVVHLADFHAVEQSMVHDIFQMWVTRVKMIISQNS